MKFIKNFLIHENLLIYTFIVGVSLRLAVLLLPEQYWFDEILSLYISRYSSSLTDLFSFLRLGEYHPPFYYVLMFYWTRLFGISEVVTRSLSCIFGIITLFVFYFFCKRFCSKSTSLLALLLLAVNPLHIEYSAEARPYTLFTLIGLLASLVFQKLLEKRTIRRWFLFIMLNSIGLYTHYSYSFILLAFLAYQIYSCFQVNLESKKRFSLKEIVFFLIMIGVGYLPWIQTVIVRYIESGAKFINSDFGSDFERIGYFPTFSEYVIASLIWFLKAPVNKFQMILISVGKILYLFLFIPFIKDWKKKQSSMNLLLLFLFSVPIVAFLLSKYYLPYTSIPSRHILFSLFPLCIITSLSIQKISTLNKRIIITSVLLLSMCVPLIQELTNDSDYLRDHRLGNIARNIKSKEQPGDLILLDHHIFPVIFKHYYSGQSTVSTYFPEIKDTNVVYLTNGSMNSRYTKYMIHSSRVLNEENINDLGRMVDNFNRIWLVRIVANPNYIDYLFEKGWIVREILTTDKDFSVLLFEKDSKANGPVNTMIDS